MDPLQWKLTRLTDLQTVIQYRNSAVLCLQEINLRPAHTLNVRGFTPCRYDRPDGDRANCGTAILGQDCIFSSAVNIRSTLQASAVPVTLSSLPLTVCNIHLPPTVPMDRTELSHLLSQLPLSFILVGDLNSKHILWGSSLSSDWGRIASDVCAGFSLILLNTGVD
jgi:hypothetical protein